MERSEAEISMDEAFESVREKYGSAGLFLMALSLCNDECKERMIQILREHPEETKLLLLGNEEDERGIKKHN